MIEEQVNELELVTENRMLRERVRELEKSNERLTDANNILWNRWEKCLQDYRRLEKKGIK